MKLAAIVLGLALLLLGCDEVIEVEEPPGAASATEMPYAFASADPTASPQTNPSDTPASTPFVEQASVVEESDVVQENAAGTATSAPRPTTQMSSAQTGQAAFTAGESGSNTSEETALPVSASETTPVSTAPPVNTAPVATVRPTERPSNCDPSYPDVCIPIGAEDYDCAGGGGNGPNYISGTIRVLPPDPHELDRDGDGFGCEPRPSPP
jgi:hypothetical protein